MALSVVYDPRYQSWNGWASLMCEAYANQQLQIPADEDTWKDWAAGFRGIDSFARDGVPDPYQFDDWREWASAVINVVTVQ